MREIIAKTVAVAAVFGVVALSTQAFSIQEPDVGASAQVSAGDHHPDTVIAPQRERRVGVSRYGRGNEFRTAWFGERPESAGRDQEMRSTVRAVKGSGCDHVCRAEKRDAEMEADFFETGAAERGCRRMHKAGGDCGVGDTYWLVMR